MMKPFLMTFFVIACAASGSSQTFSELLQEGKSLVLAERNKETGGKPDYKPAIAKLRQAVKLQPTNAEAHYFLGSALDYDNADDGGKMNMANTRVAITASGEFEKVIRLSPKYTGAIIALDPYSKLSSIWGSLGFCYMVRSAHDSAKWAFTEGKKRGAFSDFALGYYREVLRNCANDAVFFVYGDFPTMNLWYLQEMENLRPDVDIISLTMMGVPWVTEYYYKNDHALFSSREIASDTAEYALWAEKTLEVPVKNTGKNMLWVVKPTFAENYVLRADMVLMDIITHNKFARAICFSKGAPPDAIAGLDEHLRDCFTTSILVPEKSNPYDIAFFDHFKTFPFDIFKRINMNNAEELSCEYTMRIAFLQGIYYLLNNQEESEAKKLYEQETKTFPVSKYPSENEQIEKYMNFYGQHFKL